MELQLIAAIRDGRDSEAFALLNQGACPLAKAACGTTALHEAAARGQKELTLLLLQGGADPNVFNLAGHTPVTLAAEAGHSHVYHLLCAANGWIAPSEMMTNRLAKNVLKDFMSYYGLNGKLREPLHALTAAREGRAQVLRALIHLGVNPLFKMHHGYTALHEAAVNGQEECTVVLIQCGADVQAGDDFGVTPIMLAAHAGHLGVVHLLMTAGARIHKDDYISCIAVAGRRNGDY